MYTLEQIESHLRHLSVEDSEQLDTIVQTALIVRDVLCGAAGSRNPSIRRQVWMDTMLVGQRQKPYIVPSQTSGVVWGVWGSLTTRPVQIPGSQLTVLVPTPDVLTIMGARLLSGDETEENKRDYAGLVFSVAKLVGGSNVSVREAHVENALFEIPAGGLAETYAWSFSAAGLSWLPTERPLQLAL